MAWLPEAQALDMEKVYRKAIEKNVAFVPGKYFYTQPNAGIETMRLNYTMSTADVITDAIKTLGEVLREEL